MQLWSGLLDNYGFGKQSQTIDKYLRSALLIFTIDKTSVKYYCKRSNCRLHCHFGPPRAHVHVSGGCEDRGFDTIDAILNQWPVSKWQVILQFNPRAFDVINDSDIIWQKRVLIGSLLHCILRRRSNWCIACYRGVLFHWARTILPQNVNKFIENCTYYYL